MRPGARVLVLAVSGAGLWSATQAENLGAAARREQERRAKIPAGEKPATTFTNEDIDGRTVPLPEAERVEAPAAGPATPRRETEAGSRDEPAHGESYWRSRFAAVRLAIVQAERRAADLEQAPSAGPPGPLPPRCAKPDGTTLSFPGPCGMSCYEVDRAWEAKDRRDRELNEARRKLDSARQALLDLEEQARQQRALPGWTR